MNHLKTYLLHYAAIAAGVCQVIAGYDPKLLGPDGASIVGAALTGLAVAHALGIQPATILKTVATALVLGIFLPLSGCATFQKASTVVTSPAAQPYIAAAADAAVATAEQKGVSSAEILSIAQKALAADQGASATLAGVATVVNAELAKLNLPAGDLQAAQIVELALNAAITAQIGSNATLAQAQAAVADILNDIIAAASVTAPAAVGTSGTPPTVQTVTLPSEPQGGGFLESVESPATVGAATATVIVGSLQAFAHISVNGPQAAAIAVLASVLAAWWQL